MFLWKKGEFTTDEAFKGLLHPKITPMLFQTCKSFVHLRNTVADILDENQKASDCPIDC